jgi:hypothetical protein
MRLYPNYRRLCAFVHGSAQARGCSSKPLLGEVPSTAINGLTHVYLCPSEANLQPKNTGEILQDYPLPAWLARI